ncbi:MAG: T9SS type A sorting domain-containing protein [Bacteroidetes bacterium]|nr:T9SS type A sorting domain-containing protein [Bacteroidota bacterium]
MKNNIYILKSDLYVNGNICERNKLLGLLSRLYTYSFTIATNSLLLHTIFMWMLFFSYDNLRAQSCSYPCNGQLTSSLWTAGSNQLNPFGNDSVDCWVAAGWHPQLSSTAYSTPTSAKLWSIGTIYGSSIKSKYKSDFVKGKKYIASMMVRKASLSNLNADSIILAISPNVPISINVVQPVPTWKQVVLRTTNVNDTAWKQVVACFVADTTLSVEIWACSYDGLVAAPGYTGARAEVLIDNIEIIPNFDFAGPDKTICSGTSVTIGNSCTYLGFPTIDNDWMLVPSVTSSDRDPVNTSTFTTNIAGTYMHSRKYTDRNGNVLACATDTDYVVVSSGVTPSFTLGNDTTICQPNRYWLKPKNLSPSGRKYYYSWNTGSSIDSVYIDMRKVFTLTITDSASGCQKTVSITINRDPDILPWQRSKLYCSSSLPASVCTKTGYSQYYYSINGGAFVGPSSSNCATITSANLIGGKVTVVFKVKALSIAACFGYDTLVINTTSAKFKLPNDTTICGSSYIINMDSQLDSIAWYNLSSPTTVISRSNSFTITATGSYIMKAFDPKGCLLGHDTITVKLNNPPHIVLGKYPLSTVCQTGLILLDSVATPYGGKWYGTAVKKIGTKYYFNIDTASCGNNTISYAYTDSAGCKDSAVATVTKYCGKHIDSIPPQCTTNDSILLTGQPPFGAFYGTGVTHSAGIGYYFHPQNFSSYITGTTTKVYLNYTDSAGCQGTDSLNIQIIGGPRFTTGHDNSDFSGCGDTVTATTKCLKDGIGLWIEINDDDNDGYTTLWSNGSGYDEITVYDTGIYWVRVTLPNGCSRTEYFHIKDDPCNCCMGDTVVHTYQKEYYIDGFDYYPTTIRYTPWDSGHVTLAWLSDHQKAWEEFSNSEYLVLTKTDIKGNIQWSKKYKFDYNVYPTDMELDDTNIVILADKQFMHDSTDERWDDSSDMQVLIMKTDMHGTVLAQEYFGGRAQDHGHDLLIADNKYWVTGSGRRIYTDLRFNPWRKELAYLNGTVVEPGSLSLCDIMHAWDQSIWVLKVDKSLNFIDEWLYSRPSDTCVDEHIVAFRTSTTENGVRILPSINNDRYIVMGNGQYEIYNCDTTSPVHNKHTSDILLFEINGSTGAITSGKNKVLGFDGQIDNTTNTSKEVDMGTDMIKVDSNYYITGYTNSDPRLGGFSTQDTIYYTYLAKIKGTNLTEKWLANNNKGYSKLYRMEDSLFTCGLSLMEFDGYIYVHGSTYRNSESSVPYFMAIDNQGNNINNNKLNVYFHGIHAGPPVPVFGGPGVGSFLSKGYGNTFTLTGTHNRNGFGHLGGFQVNDLDTGLVECSKNYNIIDTAISHLSNSQVEMIEPCDQNQTDYSCQVSNFKPDMVCCQIGQLDSGIIVSGFNQGYGQTLVGKTKNSQSPVGMSKPIPTYNHQPLGIALYPNPADNLVNIELSGLAVGKKGWLKIINFEGKTLATYLVQAEGNKINKILDTQLYPAGVYLLQWSDGDKLISKKLFINR